MEREIEKLQKGEQTRPLEHINFNFQALSSSSPISPLWFSPGRVHDAVWFSNDISMVGMSSNNVVQFEHES